MRYSAAANSATALIEPELCDRDIAATPTTQRGLAKWFHSLSDGELVLLGAWSDNLRLDMPLMMSIADSNGKSYPIIALSVQERVFRAYGVSEDGNGGAISGRGRLADKATQAARSIEGVLCDCQLRRNRLVPMRQDNLTAADLRLSEMIELVKLVRQRPDCMEVVEALAPAWVGSVDDLVACAVALSEVG